MERMITIRLLNYSDQKGVLSLLQCEGRTHQITTYNALSLETTVRNMQANNDISSLSFFTWKQDVTQLGDMISERLEQFG